RAADLQRAWRHGAGRACRPWLGAWRPAAVRDHAYRRFGDRSFLRLNHAIPGQHAEHRTRVEVGHVGIAAVVRVASLAETPTEFRDLGTIQDVVGLDERGRLAHCPRHRFACNTPVECNSRSKLSPSRSAAGSWPTLRSAMVRANTVWMNLIV